MNIKRPLILAAGTLCALMFAAALSADDTEIFFNTSETEIRPNLLFVLDNSGSMDAMVASFTPYDPVIDYSGDYASDNIYYAIWKWERNPDGWGYYRVPIYYSIATSTLQCPDVITGLARSGHLVGYRMAYKKRGDWEDLDGGNISSETICEANSTVNLRWSRYSARDVYSANYLNWYYGVRADSYEEKTRLQVMKDVAKNLADSLTDVNIGLMAFNTDGAQRQGGSVLVPMADIDGNRDAFKLAVDALNHETKTPLAETLFGAMRYYSGLAPFLDTTPESSTIDAASGNYISPIGNACQSNNVIFLTDGAPTCDGYSSTTALCGDNKEDTDSQATMSAAVDGCTGNCMDEIAGHMQNGDIYTGLADDQFVTTYTVGFHSDASQLDQDLLIDAAEAGGGEYYLASSAASLQNVFEGIVRSVMAVNTTFVAPGVAVNTFNRLNHLDALYFSVFQPDLSPRWNGNLKRYRLGSDGNIYDQNNKVAVSPSTGFFEDIAQSWWSPEPDGPNVPLGGAASEFPDDNATRKVYTWYPGSTSDLTAAANAVSVANKANLTADKFSDTALTPTAHDELINWTRGLDVHDEDNDGITAEPRKFIADPLHSVPHLVIYGRDETTVEDTTDLDTTVFFGDNQGFIHAINGTTGQPYFSFIPSKLLKNQALLLDNPNALEQRIYGMDSSVVSWQLDANHDNEITASDGDRVVIYAGMRRGGRSYYALDVTTRTQPEMVWTITGGSTGFEELGQTWSKPVKTKIMVNKNVVEVLIFAGGYDTAQDDATVRTADTVGRALYMVNAITGERIWWASHGGSTADLKLTNMIYSIPASPKALDTTGDGLVDQIYVGDMGGQVWRFDVTNNTDNDSSFGVTGGVIADLGGTTEATNRRFYHSPDLFGVKFGGDEYLGLVIGSGWQAHPMNKVVDDRIYLLRIADINGPPQIGTGEDAVVDYAHVKVTEGNLFDATNNHIQQGTDAEKAVAKEAWLDAPAGWYIRLTNDGEKVLSSSQTVGGQVFITTYEPVPPVEVASCVPGTGTPRMYHIDAKDGSAIRNYDDIGSDDALTIGDRALVLATSGLPPDPQRMRINGQDVICVGAECHAIDSVTGLVETYWYEE